MLACKKQNLTAAKFFLDNGADINAASNPGMTALYEACATGDLNTVQFLLDYQKPDSKSDKPLVDVNTCTNIGSFDYSETYRFGGESPLIIALKRCSRMHAGQLNHLRAEAQKKKQDKVSKDCPLAIHNPLRLTLYSISWKQNPKKRRRMGILLATGSGLWPCFCLT